MLSKGELEQALLTRFPAGMVEKLASAKVAVAGLGGLGSHIAVMLARSGIGQLLLVDFDRVDITNLNRQAYFIPHLGQYKTDALQHMLQEINPYLVVTTECVRVTEENAAEIFGAYPIVCEAFDRPENKAMLISTLLSQCPAMKIVSGSGMAGYGDCNQIQTRKKMSRLYVCGDGVTGLESSVGLMAPRVAVCAGHQANQVLRLILENEGSNDLG